MIKKKYFRYIDKVWSKSDLKNLISSKFSFPWKNDLIILFIESESFSYICLDKLKKLAISFFTFLMFLKTLPLNIDWNLPNIFYRV